MGIHGLWQVLEPCCQPVRLESLEGKRLAVDVSLWIYQGGAKGLNEIQSPHLAITVSRLCKLLFYKIRPIFVFDGRDVPVFKKRVLRERRLKEAERDVLLNKDTRKQLENLATGTRDEEEVIKAMHNPTKRLKQGDQAIFNLPSTSREVVELSDDDADIAVEKVVDNGIQSKSSDIERLVELREQIRVSRLHPDAIPTKTTDFCNFQLARVLGRNKIDRTIKKLTKERQDEVTGANVKVAVADRREAHVISYDGADEIQVVDHEPTTSKESNWTSLGFTLDYLQPTLNVSSESKESEDDIDCSDFAELTSRDFFSKSSMIENLMKRRIGASQAEAVRQDAWSSDSGDDDFIDVSDGESKLFQVAKPESKEEVKDEKEDREWSPGAETFPINAFKPHSVNLIKPLDEEDFVPEYRDIQQLLTACGFPWIQSPGEAEAQCVELERLGFVDGIVSDDSDVWPFGAQKVYRHLFAREKNVQFYNRETILNITSLSQSNFVEIAMIAGGDYSEGIVGVGIVKALELIAEFSSNKNVENERKEIIDTMSALEKWLFNKPPHGEPNTTRRSIRTLIEKNNILNHLRGISNPDIVDAYLQPNVDHSREPLRWKKVDIDRLKNHITNLLGWTDEKFNMLTLPSFEKWNEFIAGTASYQKHITSYTLVQAPDEQKIVMTKRVADALQRLRRKMNPEPSSLICQTTFEDSGSIPSAAANNKLHRPLSRKRPRQTKKKPAQALPKLNLSESSESDF